MPPITDAMKRASCRQILEWLVRGRRARPGLAVVAAHPDDESIGAGGRLVRLRKSLFIYLTDGAPRDMADALAAGFSSRAEYAAARAGELARALALAGVDHGNVRRLDCVDQESAFQIAATARALALLFRETEPEAVLTHAYEGGHPDHDSAALLVYAARKMLDRAKHWSPAVIEMTSYHRRGEVLETGHFLPDDGGAAVAALSDAERRLKARLFGCYRTQAAVLKNFSIDVERFRPAPEYDFSRPPHTGILHYETLPWRLDGLGWRRRIAAALQELEIQ